jgi:hypothetical protein
VEQEEVQRSLVMGSEHEVKRSMHRVALWAALHETVTDVDSASGTGGFFEEGFNGLLLLVNPYRGEVFRSGGHRPP